MVIRDVRDENESHWKYMDNFFFGSTGQWLKWFFFFFNVASLDEQLCRDFPISYDIIRWQYSYSWNSSESFYIVIGDLASHLCVWVLYVFCQVYSLNSLQSKPDNMIEKWVSLNHVHLNYIT